MKILTDSVPDAAGVEDSSFFCFGFAFAKELNKLPFSFFSGAAFSAGFADKEEFWRCTGFGGSVRSSVLSSSFFGWDGSDCAGRFAGTVLEGAGGGGGGRAPVLLCSRSSQPDMACLNIDVVELG